MSKSSKPTDPQYERFAEAGSAIGCDEDLFSSLFSSRMTSLLRGVDGGPYEIFLIFLAFKSRSIAFLKVSLLTPLPSV